MVHLRLCAGVGYIGSPKYSKVDCDIFLNRQMCSGKAESVHRDKHVTHLRPHLLSTVPHTVLSLSTLHHPFTRLQVFLL